MRSPIFRKLLGGSFLLIGLALVGLDTYLTRYTERHQVADVEQRLAAECRILAGEVAGLSSSRLEIWAHDAAARAQARVTIISVPGLVLAESNHDPESMENHAGRPEVRQALAGGIGTAVRHSATVDRDLSYVAIRIDYAGQPAVLRLAVPLEEVDAAVAEVRWRILEASAIAALGALLIAYFFSRSLTGRIQRLKTFSEGLLDSGPAEEPLPAADDELGALGRSVTEMSSRIHDLIGRLKLESAQREAILLSMVEGVLAVDRDLRVISCNSAFARAAGTSYPLPERLPLVELVRDPELIELVHRVLETGEAQKDRVELRAPEKHSYEVQVTPLTTGSGRGAIVLLHDITDLERLERVRKDFVANVSHELRTPLTAIQGYAETLLDGALEDSENNRRFVEIIRAQAIRLSNIASDLLTLSELDSGKSASAPEPVSIGGALEGALLSVEAEARVRNVAVHRGRVEDFEVLGQKTRLEQVLVNLLHNAVKFNRPDGEVRVEAVRIDGTGRIVISDTGIGIPSEDLPRIFERFYRVDRARSRAVGGTGLGLSIVKHVVENMGGQVRVDSHLGKGSIFTVTLPRLADPELSGTLSSPEPESCSPPAAGDRAQDSAGRDPDSL
jgi:two-component system phosphate regulon sensor histidine kinase PhoR